MSPVFSTPAGATVTYLSSTWPWSLHASSRNMTFWNDLLSALAQLSLFSSSTVAVAAAAVSSTWPAIGPFASTSAVTTAASATPLASSTIALHQALKSHGNARDNLKQSINQSTHGLLLRGIVTHSEFSDSGGSASDAKMLNISNVPSPTAPLNETLSIGATAAVANFTTDSVLNSLVDCNDFTEQKLLNIVICSYSDVNNNLLVGSGTGENSTFNETFRNVSDDLIRLYNNSLYYNETTEVSWPGNNTTEDNASQFESTIYFIQVVTTAVILGIIILATVIGELLIIISCFVCLIENKLIALLCSDRNSRLSSENRTEIDVDMLLKVLSNF